MKTARPRKTLRRGFVSYVLVLAAGLTLTLLTLSAYKRATMAHKVQSESQIRVDFADKEDEILRAIVNITPNRAIRAMQAGSGASSSTSNPLRWQNIFSDALDQANARTSVSNAMKTAMGASSGIGGNVGDSTLSNLSSIFDAIEPEPGYMSTGMNRSLGGGFPVPLEGQTVIKDLDLIYPLITSHKIYGNLASGGVSLPVATYSQLNVIPYPEIRFGYSTPGQPFVAKRNWWAFSLQLGENDQLLKSFSRGDGSVGERDFIISIYEIPSQLAISAEAFANLGKHSDGTPWQNANIEGGVYTTRAEVDSGLHIDRISGRRGLTLSSDVTVGDNALGGNPFTPGVREQFEISNGGAFMPVTLASESGRATFVPINRGADFFDRFAHATVETNAISPTTWNNYSVGALQCAMRLDVTAVASATDPMPTMLRFSYLTGATGTTRSSPLYVPMNYSAPVALEPGYVWKGDQGATVDLGATPVDVAYGVGGKFVYRRGLSGSVTFDLDTFGDPNPGVSGKKGYVRPALPFDVKLLHDTKRSICIYPERLPDFVTALGGSSATYNNSIVLNVDYSSTGLNNSAYKPKIPCTDDDYGVLMTECDDLVKFTRGFSLVTNMRLYIGDDFNIVPTAVPAGSGLAAPFFPPASLFAPEKRYGTDYDPAWLELNGQVGHLGGDTGEGSEPVHLLDLKMGSETEAAASKIDVNLKPITHPAELPPITMMNWLVMIEERRKAFYNSDGSAK
jgi:hypothetical protein